MSMEKIKLAVLFGGRSSEHEVSCVSAAAVIDNASSRRYEVIPVGITREGAWWWYTGETAKIRSGEWEQDKEHLVPAVPSPCTVHHGLLVFHKPTKTYEVKRLDCILPVVHGENCEDGKLQGLLEAGGVPYVGCQTCSSAITMDKAFTKMVLDGHGISQAEWLLLRPEDYQSLETAKAKIQENLSYPVFVKPANAGSSKGISRVKDADELEQALALAAAIDPKIVVEASVKGQEIEVALLDEWVDGKRVTRATLCGEICPDSDFYSYESKYLSGGSLCLIPARLKPEVAQKVRETALKIFSLLDCRGLSRADFFVTEKDEVIFNEINTLPGCTPISMYPKLWEQEGIPFPQLVDRWVDFAMKGETL